MDAINRRVAMQNLFSFAKARLPACLPAAAVFRCMMARQTWRLAGARAWTPNLLTALAPTARHSVQRASLLCPQNVSFTAGEPRAAVHLPDTPGALGRAACHATDAAGNGCHRAWVVCLQLRLMGMLLPCIQPPLTPSRFPRG